MEKAIDTIVLKVGGAFFTNAEAQKDLFSALHIMQSNGKKIILVHGGGNQVQALLKALGYESNKHEGLRITPAEHMPVVSGVLAGTLNKSLVSTAKQHGIQAVGISLADGEMCHCEPVSEALGSVGKPVAYDGHLLSTLLNAKYVPIISSIGTDNFGNLFNVNADQAATCIAELTNANLYLLSDVEGVLDENRQLLSSLLPDDIEELSNKEVIKDGMLVKVRAAQQASSTLNKPVYVASWTSMSQLVSSTRGWIGTRVLSN